MDTLGPRDVEAARKLKWCAPEETGVASEALAGDSKGEKLTDAVELRAELLWLPATLPQLPITLPWLPAELMELRGEGIAEAALAPPRGLDKGEASRYEAELGEYDREPA